VRLDKFLKRRGCHTGGGQQEGGSMPILAAAASRGPDLSYLWVALAAIFSSITAPMLLVLINNRQLRRTRTEDYARQDKVAEKAATVARSLLNQQAEQAAHVAETARLLAERQGEIAEAAAQAARLLLETQAAAIRRTDEVARLAAETALVADHKLDSLDAQARRIHALVNSDMTDARQSELNRARELLIVEKRVVALTRLKGAAPDLADIEAIGRTQTRITELEAILADRLRQLREVEADAVAPSEEEDVG
jgi:hypothetical protein